MNKIPSNTFNQIPLASQESYTSSEAQITADDVERFEPSYIKSNDIWGCHTLLLTSQDGSTSSATADDIIFQFQEPRESIVTVASYDTYGTSAATAEGCTTPSAIPKDKFNFICVASGKNNQSYFKDGANSQCVTLASSGFSYFVVKKYENPQNNNIFTTHDIDQILTDGNKVYVEFLRGQRPYFIEPEQLPRMLSICNHSIMVTQPEWVLNGLYAMNQNQLSQSIDDLSKHLCETFRKEEYKTPKDGFLFTGLNYTVSFWKDEPTNSSNSDPRNTTGSANQENDAPDDPENGVFYLFNSHAVNENNIYSNDKRCNGAKLFKINGTKNLASLLLKNSPCDGIENQYSIHNIKVISFTRITNETTSSTNIVEDGENVIDTLSVASTGPTKKTCNLKKVTSGTKKQKGNAQIENDENANNTLSTDHSQINTPIATTNKRGRPKKATKGQKKQKLENANDTLSVVPSQTVVFTEPTKKAGNPKKVTSGMKNQKGNAQKENDENANNMLSTDHSQINTPIATTNKRGRPKKASRGQKKQKLENANDTLSVGPSQTVVFTETTKKAGNPKKVTSGTKKQKGNAQIEKDENANNTLSTDHSQINTPIATTNKRGRPKKVNRGQKKQKLENANDTLSVVPSQTVFTETTKKDGNPKKVTSGTKKQKENAQIENDENTNNTLSIDHSQINTPTATTNKGGRPKKVTRGQKKQKENAHLEATIKYNTKRPEVHRTAVNRYTTANPEVNRTAVSRYTTENPEVHRTAVSRYTTANPEVHRTAVSRYTAANPEVHRTAVSRYTTANPEVNRESAARYRVNNPEQRRITNNSYNNLRHITPVLRAGTTLISERSGDDLDVVPLYSLKNSCLVADNVYRCPHCNTKLFEEEKSRKEWCCGHGRFNVLNLPAIDERFYAERYFIKQARSYNNLFAFSALGVSHGFHQQATGLSFVKIQGRVYHRIFDLSHSNDLGPNPIGLYIDDGEERQRLAENRGLDQNILREISEYLHRVNPFIDCFKRLSEETSDEAHLIFEHTTRRTHGNILGDMPRGNEIAAIMSTEREPYQPRSICIWKIGESRAHTIDVFNPLYEALQYPLLYPHGGSGWTIDTLDNAANKLSQVKYYRCLLLSEVRFWQLGRLSEEWLVDMYCRVEEERLRFIARMQNRNSNTELRSAPLEEVINSEIARQISDDETIQGEGGVVPGKVYLPNTFTGGPRYMKCKYMDAIAIVNRLGRPSYFLTVTCNPKWPEIQENTPRYCTPPAALCARVFNLKLNELIKDIRSGAWFGKLVYLLYVIEFQKRGLPHAHICFRVEGGGPVQNIDIDKVVRADIPSEQEAEGRLRTVVLKHMIHGPCGLNHRTDLPCWDAEKMKCNKRFPKPATETTHTDDRGFVNLKRSETNTATITYRSNNVSVNDRWVVPYNAALLLKYDCHMNLEIASTRKIIKYLFKYMTKGPDEARVAIVPDEHRDNEIEQYVTKRYIGACDAAWRIFEFDVTARQPNVKQLTVHLEGQQSVFFKQGTESEAVERSSSDLLKYFNRPTEPEFNNLTYQDFYENYFVESSRPKTKNVTIYPICNGKYFVKKRQRGEMVARLFWVTPNRGEQFYLRMLLSVRPCRGYTDLLSLGGPNCTTFQEAARAIGIANDEGEYERCIQEAAGFYTGKRLRHFFVLLITNGAPALILWNQFKQVLSEDILERHLSQDAERAYERALVDIDRLLRKHGSRLQDHGLPAVEDASSELSRERSEYDSSRLNQFVEHWLPLLSREQKQVFDHVCTLLTGDNSSNETSHKALFLDGPSGTGKTLLLNLIVAYVRGILKGVAICTASSGIAAQNYEGGCTAHSMFRFPLDLIDDNGYWSLTNLSQRAELIRESSIIIYDEAPMAHKYLIHLLDRSLQDLMGSSLLFGGKIIILAGDFRQIPPVVTTARCPNDVVQASLRSSPLWQSLRKFSLTEAQRTREDEGYSDFLLNLGSGACETVTLGTGRDTVNLLNLQNISFVTELTDLLSFVFPEDTLQDPDICASRAILTTHNANVREINARILECVSGDIIHCYSVDCVDPEHADDFHLGQDTLHKVQAKGVPDYDLRIKKGCVCMIIRNLSFVDRLVNGTKVIVVDVSPRLITIRKPYESETYLIPRISFKAPIEPGSPIEMCRRQFPLQVCYAMTVHKSQGQTIDRVGVDLRSDVFSHGQLYVALGRVRDKQNIKILIRRERVINGQPHANNVVIRSFIE